MEAKSRDESEKKFNEVPYQENALLENTLGCLTPREIAKLTSIKAESIIDIAFSFTEAKTSLKVKSLLGEYRKLHGIILIQKNDYLSGKKDFDFHLNEAFYGYMQSVIRTLMPQYNSPKIVTFGAKGSEIGSLKIHNRDYIFSGATSRISKIIEFSNLILPPTIIPDYNSKNASDGDCASKALYDPRVIIDIGE